MLKPSPEGEGFNPTQTCDNKNVEELLSYLFSDWPWKGSNEKALDQALYKEFTYEISKQLSSIAPKPLSDEYQNFIRFLGADNNQIITLNYDNLIDELYGKYCLPKNDKFSGLDILVEDIFDEQQRTTEDRPFLFEDIESADGARKRLTIRRNLISNMPEEDFDVLVESSGVVCWTTQSPSNFILRQYNDWSKYADIYSKDIKDTFSSSILRLHGSIDWYENSSSEETIRVTDTTGISHLENIPVIIPPVLDKSQHYAISQVRNQWSKAYSALEGADEIVIIGFSFPPTDISCQFLFKSALKARNGVHVIVVNPDENVRERYGSVFKNISVDYSYTGDNKVFDSYIKQEILRKGNGSE